MIFAYAGVVPYVLDKFPVLYIPRLASSPVEEIKDQPQVDCVVKLLPFILDLLYQGSISIISEPHL